MKKKSTEMLLKYFYKHTETQTGTYKTGNRTKCVFRGHFKQMGEMNIGKKKGVIHVQALT